MGAIIQQALFIPFDYHAERMIFFGWLGVAVMTKAVLGFLLVIFAEKIARFLFKENTSIITDGAINGTALFRVGLSLLGFYFLLSYLPALMAFAEYWFRTEAAEVKTPDFDPRPYYSPVQLIVMTVLSLILIFRNKTIANWVIRASK